MHNDVIKWEHFSRYWPFVRGIHRFPVNSPHKGQWRGALIFSLILARINGWVNNGEASDLRHHRAHYDVIVVDWSNMGGRQIYSSKLKQTVQTGQCSGGRFIQSAKMHSKPISNLRQKSRRILKSTLLSATTYWYAVTITFGFRIHRGP